MGEEISSAGLTNWTRRIDERVTRLEERLAHTADNGERMRATIEALGGRITSEVDRMSRQFESESREVAGRFEAESKAIRAQVQSLYRIMVGGLVSLVTGTVLLAARIVWEVIAR